MLNQGIIAVDDHPLVLNALQRVFNEHIGSHVLCFERAETALAYVRSEPVKLIVTDLIMPGKDGFWLCTEARKLQPAIKICIFSQVTSLSHISQAMKLKVEGYLLKTTPPIIVANALKTILKGELFYSKEVTDAFFKASVNTEMPALTTRESDVLMPRNL